VTHGTEALQELVGRLNVRHAAIITDENVAPLYASNVADVVAGLGLKPSLHVFPAGEDAKTLTTVETMMRSLRAAEVDRGGCIVALGGGVVGDVAGFVAATYLRGLPVVQVPTTLLAQVDSSVGGKTGVNLDAEKNLVGAFHPPSGVLASMSTLDTLPEPVYRAGFAELLKHGVIADPLLTTALTRNPDAIAARVPLALARWVRASVAVKRDIVESDPREKGRRKVLNFGHTFGHAFESASHFELSHGDAVALGMLVATWMGERLGETDAGTYDALHAALTAIGLPTDWRRRLNDRVLHHLLADKKRAGADLDFVFARRIGEVDIRKVPLNTIQDLATAARSSGPS
jgi:3-dehydroquinate synthase